MSFEFTKESIIKIDTIDLRFWRFETIGLDSGFRRRDEFEAWSLFVIPAKAGIQ
jgi:hypothetical protein